MHRKHLCQKDFFGADFGRSQGHHGLRCNPYGLGRVAVWRGPALQPKIVPDKAQGAGRSHSAVKSCNAVWRDFGPQPFGTAAILPQYGVAARSCSTLHDAHCALSCNKMAAGAASGQTATGPRRLSDSSDRREQGGRMRANASNFEANSGSIQREKRRICAIIPPAQ